jgi:nicotinate (nicotinamide) nucleotide adenylyltransferase
MNLSEDEWACILQFFVPKDLIATSLVSSTVYHGSRSNHIWYTKYYHNYRFEIPASVPLSWYAEYKKQVVLEKRWFKGSYHEVALEGVHRKTISSLFYDGKTLLTGSHDGVVGQWDILSGRYMRQWSGLSGVIYYLGVIQTDLEKRLVVCVTKMNNRLSLAFDEDTALHIYDMNGGDFDKEIKTLGQNPTCNIADSKIFLASEFGDAFAVRIYSKDGNLLYHVDEVLIFCGYKGVPIPMGILIPTGMGAVEFSSQEGKIVEIRHSYYVSSASCEQDGKIFTFLPVEGKFKICGPDATEYHDLSDNLELFSGTVTNWLIDSYHHDWVIISTNTRAVVFKLDEATKTYSNKFLCDTTGSGIEIKGVKIDNYKALIHRNDYTIQIFCLETRQCVTEISGFYKNISSILATRDILFVGSQDSTTRIFHYSEKVLQRYQLPKYEILTPIDKIGLISTEKPNLVLVLTGAFSPIHQMHIQMLENMKIEMETLGYNVTGGYLSPSHDLYNKYGLLSASDRIEMCELAVKDSKWIMVDKWEASQSEFRLQNDVLEHLKLELQDLNVEIVYCCGSDNLQLTSYVLPKFRTICQLRPEFPILEKEFIQNALKDKRLFLCKMEITNISSSLVRLKQGSGQSFNDLLHPLVFDYIVSHKLYDIEK